MQGQLGLYSFLPLQAGWKKELQVPLLDSHVQENTVCELNILKTSGKQAFVIPRTKDLIAESVNLVELPYCPEICICTLLDAEFFLENCQCNYLGLP